MGHIDISDGVSKRRIPIPGLEWSIRIEVDQEPPRIIIPKGVDIERQQP